MFIAKNKSIIITILLSTLLAISYFSFVSYKPKSLKTIQEVKGVHTSALLALPFPDNSVNVSTTTSENSKQMTFESTRTPEEIQQFYKTILLGDEWRLDSEMITTDSIISIYKTDDQQVKVKSTRAEATLSVASLEISER